MKKLLGLLVQSIFLSGMVAPTNRNCPDTPLAATNKTGWEPTNGRTYGNAQIRGCDDELFSLGGGAEKAGGAIKATPLWTDSLNDTLHFFLEPSTSSRVTVHLFALDTKSDIEHKLKGSAHSFIGLTIVLEPVGYGEGLCTYDLIVLTGDGDQLPNRRRNRRFQFRDWSNIIFSLSSDQVLTISIGEIQDAFVTQVPQRVLGPLEKVGVAVHVTQAELPVLVSWSTPCDEVTWTRESFTMDHHGCNFNVKWSGRSLYNVAGIVLQHWDGSTWSTIKTWAPQRTTEATLHYETTIPAISGQYRLEAIDDDGSLHPLKPYFHIGK